MSDSSSIGNFLLVAFCKDSLERCLLLGASYDPDLAVLFFP